MMHDIEIKHLRLIKTISETGNLTRAANLLNISQPALSRQLKDIEERLQTSLFERTKKRMIPTKTGEALSRSARIVLDELKRIEQDVAKSLHGETGELNIGVHCVLSYKWLPKMLKHYTALYPRVNISVGNSKRIISELKNRTCDFIISSFPFNHKEIIQTPLFEDDIFVVTAPGHRLSARPFVTESDFNGEVLISFAEESQDSFLQICLLPLGVSLKSFYTVDQPEGIIEMVRSGMGIALLPKWSIQSFLDDRTLIGVPFSKTGLRLTWNVTYLDNGPLPMYRQQFINLFPDFTPVA